MVTWHGRSVQPHGRRIGGSMSGLILQSALHVGMALVLVNGMEDAPYCWEFWVVMIGLVPIIRLVDEWYR